MRAPCLQPGDRIGLASPCFVPTRDWTERVSAAIEKMGYRVKLSNNIHARSWGYAASDTERAADLNQLINDPEVKMIFFGGGEGADDVLPLLDYDAVRRNPKLYLSYSDGTSILNAVWAASGQTVLYGQSPGFLPALENNAYNLAQFRAFTEGFPQKHVQHAPWKVISNGMAEGTLIGGYLSNFIFLCATGRIPLDKKYILFLEDHIKFFGIEAESAIIGRLEQCGIMPHVTGLVFGHYSAPVHSDLIDRLKRLSEKWQIPAVYTDDFGHSDEFTDVHAILPLGAKARLDTDSQLLLYV